MEAVDARKAWLEVCFGSEEKYGGQFYEERNEKRMEGDVDWTGVIVQRFIDKEREAEFNTMGVTVYMTDEHYLETVSASK